MLTIPRRLIDEVYAPCFEVFTDLRKAGYPIDAAYLARLRDRLETEYDQLIQEIKELTGLVIDPASRTCDIESLTFGMKATDSKAAEEIRLILRLRDIKCALDTFAGKPDSAGPGRFLVEYLYDPRHTRKPCPANLTPDILTNDLWGVRRVFAARAGHQIVVADLAQLEMRVLAAASGDEILLTAIDDDVDLHSLAAGRLFARDGKPPDDQPLDKVQRDRAKAIQFSLFAGAGAHTLSERQGVSFPQAKALVADYFREFPGVKRFIHDVHKRVSCGEVICDLFGRKVCYVEEELPGPPKEDGTKRNAERERKRKIIWNRRITRNFVIEAPAVTIKELAMLRCHQHLGADHPDIQMILSRADELHFEVPTAKVDHFASELPDLMTNLGLERFGVNVPLTVDVQVGPTWGDLSPFRPRQTCV